MRRYKITLRRSSWTRFTTIGRIGTKDAKDRPTVPRRLTGLISFLDEDTFFIQFYHWFYHFCTMSNVNGNPHSIKSMQPIVQFQHAWNQTCIIFVVAYSVRCNERLQIL
mmetsp:Transcript_78378/g.210858  ORF Transcript_78378/g.210858 Transcript_78378/m.210858 type:complete len:109 (-) Transcript_78378:143-469(-)